MIQSQQAALESIAKDEKRIYYERGEALIALRDCGAFTPSTGAEYCESALGYSIERANQFINATRVVRHLQAAKCEIMPPTEAHARPLTAIPSPRMAEVWDFIGAISPTPIPTSEFIAAVCEVVKRDPAAPLRFATATDLPADKWPTDNMLDIPSLILDYQAVSVPLPIAMYGGGRARSAPGAGTYHFYTDDSRFTGLINDPTPVVNSGVLCCVEPNFSIYGQLPRVLGLGRIYHKRAIARYWQSQGIAILADLNVAPEFYSDNLLGLPDGWSAFATRGYVDRLSDTIHEYEIARTHAGRDDILFMVYGGGQAVKDEAAARGWLWVPEDSDSARGRSAADVET